MSDTMHKCYLCGQVVRAFIPYKGGRAALSNFLRDQALSGSDLDNFLCPHCGCMDRIRHIFMFFDALGYWKYFEAKAVLHFAPEEHLVRRIRECNPARYVCAKFEAGTDGDSARIDATDIPWPDNSFDALICNHVLEHIKDDRRAMSELYRVLAPGGMALLQTPYSLTSSETLEAPEFDTPELRERYYGEDVHVRLYGRGDFLSRLESAGFRVLAHRHGTVLRDFPAAYWGVNPDEELLAAFK